jgi:glycosyltransferase involved in cell wall biosynthesis
LPPDPAARKTPRNDAPVVSVIIPCWNAQGGIERALSSVLDEQSVPLECIVVDDASTDATASIVKRVAARDSRVVLVELPKNEGVSNARNRALELARGEWLMFVDADDRLVPGSIATLVDTARRTDAIAVIGQRVWVDGRRRWIPPRNDTPDIREPGRKSLAGSPGLLYYASMHGKLFRRSSTDGLRFHGRVLGDQPWTIRALLRAGDRIEVIGTTVYEWNRPRRGHFAPTITTSTRSSAGHGIEAIAVAQEALAAVRAEADRVLPDPEQRSIIAARYVERLLTSDLAVHLSKALSRRDARTGELLAAIQGFIATVPNELVSASDALTRFIVEPPLARWNHVPAEARAAYWSLFDAALAADPELLDRGSSRLARFALRLKPQRGGLRRPMAIAILGVDRVLGIARLGAARVARGVRRRLGLGRPF